MKIRTLIMICFAILAIALWLNGISLGRQRFREELANLPLTKLEEMKIENGECLSFWAIYVSEDGSSGFDQQYTLHQISTTVGDKYLTIKGTLIGQTELQRGRLISLAEGDWLGLITEVSLPGSDSPKLTLCFRLK